MAIFDRVATTTENFKGYTGNPPTTESEYNALDCWVDKSKAPSWDSISSDVALEKVRQNRRDAFPSIGDQLDMQYHDQLNGTTTWKDAVAKVKADNPKE